MSDAMVIFSGHVNIPRKMLFLLQNTSWLTTEIHSMNVLHVGHSATSVADLIIMKKLEVCKKRVFNKKLPLQQIYREEMVKVLSQHKKPEAIGS